MVWEQWQGVLTVFGALLIAFNSPGQNFVGTISNAVISRRNGVLVAVGVGIGTGLWALLAVTGITTLLQTYESFSLVLQVVGGSYLVWLGVKSLLSVNKEETQGKILLDLEETEDTFTSGIKKGLLLQLANPKSAVFWVSLTALVIVPNTPLVVIVVLVLGSALLGIAYHIGLAFIFSTGIAQGYYNKHKKVMAVVFGLAFVALGFRLMSVIL